MRLGLCCRCVPCISLSGCLSSVIGAYTYFLEQSPRQKFITLWWGVKQVFFCAASVILLCLFISLFQSCLFGFIWIWHLNLFLLMIGLFQKLYYKCTYLLRLPFALFILHSHLINFRFVIQFKYNGNIGICVAKKRE